MKYIVITTKHHDGFALFDSKDTRWDVMATPYGRDIIGQLADACRRGGIRLGFYYSIMDWHHPTTCRGATGNSPRVLTRARTSIATSGS